MTNVGSCTLPRSGRGDGDRWKRDGGRGRETEDTVRLAAIDFVILMTGVPKMPPTCSERLAAKAKKTRFGRQESMLNLGVDTTAGRTRVRDEIVQCLFLL